MHVRYRVTLTSEERNELRSFVHAGKGTFRRLKRAQSCSLRTQVRRMRPSPRTSPSGRRPSTDCFAVSMRIWSETQSPEELNAVLGRSANHSAVKGPRVGMCEVCHLQLLGSSTIGAQTLPKVEIWRSASRSLFSLSVREKPRFGARSMPVGVQRSTSLWPLPIAAGFVLSPELLKPVSDCGLCLSVDVSVANPIQTL